MANAETERGAFEPKTRDPEDRVISAPETLREKMFDKTLADSFPASDPPSSTPDPAAYDSFSLETKEKSR